MQEWEKQLKFFSSEKYKTLISFLNQERLLGKSILPAEEDIFHALKNTPLSKVKVVILGQDPYPNKRHAHGLAFSIPKATKDIPKSLKNILSELKSDLGIDTSNGNLVEWTHQGVLLLNTVLTVEEGKSNSHKSKGWEILTKEVITLINEKRQNIVFILWGGHAQKFKKFISMEKHFIIESVHPSPLSSYRGFFGSKPFSKCNDYLISHGISPVSWQT